MPDYTYDPSDGTYHDDQGHAVPRKTILALLATLTAAQAAKFRVLAQQRADDVLDTAAWHAEMADTVQTGVIAGAALASGGVAQLDQGWTAGRIAQQLDYLAGFVAAVQDGTVAVTTPAEGDKPAEAAPGFLARAELYGGATHSTYMAADYAKVADLGMEFEQSVLDSGADSCAECIDAAEQGVVPLGTLSLPGERECEARCRCEMTYLTADEAAVADEGAA